MSQRGAVTAQDTTSWTPTAREVIAWTLHQEESARFGNQIGPLAQYATPPEPHLRRADLILRALGEARFELLRPLPSPHLTEKEQRRLARIPSHDDNGDRIPEWERELLARDDRQWGEGE